ncbi:Wntless-like transmembrane domain-containing protein [Entamoeba marina]
MKLQIRLDSFNNIDRAIVVAVIICAVLISSIMVLFGPSYYKSSYACAYQCESGSNSRYDSLDCTGVDPNNGETFEYQFEVLTPSKRFNKIYVTPYLHESFLEPDNPHFYAIDFETSTSLYYLDDSGSQLSWATWVSGNYSAFEKCYSNSYGECSSVLWIKESVIVHEQQKLEITMVGAKNVFSNICVIQQIGSETYGYLQLTYILLFSTFSVGMIMFYFIYLMIRKIYPQHLNFQQWLNVGLLFAILIYNDPVDLLSIAISSSFFPILHGLCNMFFLCYLIFYTIASFQIIRVEEGLLVGKKMEWVVAFVLSLGIFFSFGLASSLYLKSEEENPFSILSGSGIYALILYVIAIICAASIFLWIVFIFITSYRSVMSHSHIEKNTLFLLFNLIYITHLLVDTPVIILFCMNAYAFCMFYGFIPSFMNQYNEPVVVPDDEDTRPILFNPEEEL